MKVCLIGRDRLDKIAEPLNVIGVECLKIRTITDFFKLIEKIKDFNVMVADSPGTGLIIPILFKIIYKIPLVYRMRGNYWEAVAVEGKFFTKLRIFLANKILFRSCNAIIVTDRILRKECLNREVNDKVFVVGLPIRDLLLNVESRKSEFFTILTLTNFDYIKKIKILYYYMPIISKFLSEINGKWFIAGKGKYGTEFKNYVSKYDNVFYVGYVNPIPFLEISHVMLHLSEMEGLPNAILEGVAAELPVIVNDYEPLKVGPVIVVRNEKELIYWLRKLYENPALRRKYGIMGKKYVKKRYNLKGIGEKYEKILRTLCDVSKR